jgi:hypothetical protein
MDATYVIQDVRWRGTSVVEAVEGPQRQQTCSCGRQFDDQKELERPLTSRALKSA